MEITAVGSISEAIVCFRDSLAELPAFKNRIADGADEEQAKKHLYLDIVEQYQDELHGLRPYGVLLLAEQGGQEIAEGISIEIETGGGILLGLFDNARHNNDHQNSTLDYYNWIGSVIDEFEEQSGFSDFFPVRALQMVLRPVRTPRAERRTPDNDFWSAAWLLQYGLGES